MTSQILLVDDSDLILFRLKAILIKLGYQPVTFSNPAGALEWLAAGNLPDLILSDVEMPGMSGYDLIRQLKQSKVTARIPIMLLTSHTDISDKVAGLEAGADDYVGKNVSAAELELRVKALLARSHAQADESLQLKAKVFTVFSLRGGVGTTNLAVNLAAALAQLWNLQVPLLDLAFTRAHCGLMLNVKPAYTLAYFNDWKDGIPEGELIEKLFTAHESGVRLLAAPSSPLEAEQMNPKAVDLVWPYLVSHASYLVVDAGSQFTEAVLTALENSDRILLLIAPEFLSIKSALDALKVFEQINIPSQKISIIANNLFGMADAGTLLKKMEGALGRKIEVTLPPDPASCMQAINYGKPLIMAKERGELAQAIAQLAYRYSAPDMEKGRAEFSSPLLTAVRKRI